MAAKVFFSYSHADEDLRDQMERQLSILRRQGVIEPWHDRRIGAGQEFAREIDAHLENADIILLLVSPDFINSDYCYDIEMARALERHTQGTAIIIPVILRDCLWTRAPFGKLLATPPDGKAVTRWPDRDQAFMEVAKAIEAALARIGKAPASPSASTVKVQPSEAQPRSLSGPRSSNLRLAKTFTERDRDAFRHETFEYIARFFENSLSELQGRNSGVEGVFRRIDANRFTAVIYKSGKSAARCTIFIGSSFGDGIGFSYSETSESNSYNENLSVDLDDQTLFLKPMGFGHMGGERDAKLSQEGAAEFYWSMLINRLQ